MQYLQKCCVWEGNSGRRSGTRADEQAIRRAFFRDALTRPEKRNIAGRIVHRARALRFENAGCRREGVSATG